jgi:hypothetical protein
MEPISFSYDFKKGSISLQDNVRIHQQKIPNPLDQLEL